MFTDRGGVFKKATSGVDLPNENPPNFSSKPGALSPEKNIENGGLTGKKQMKD
jgi:hypothetical protein